MYDAVRLQSWTIENGLLFTGRFLIFAALATLAAAGLAFFVAGRLFVAALLGVAGLLVLAALTTFTTAGFTFFVAGGLFVAGLFVLAALAVFTAAGFISFGMAMIRSFVVAVAFAGAARATIRTTTGVSGSGSQYKTECQ